MRRFFIPLALAAALIAAPSAFAGGWATVGLIRPPRVCSRETRGT